MRPSIKHKYRRAASPLLANAASFALEQMEGRVMLSTTLAAWNMDNVPTSGITSTPAQSSGVATGAAYSVGMQATNAGGYTYPVAGIPAAADASAGLLATGNADSGGAGGSEDGTTGNVWRVQSGQSNLAPIGSQGAQFGVPTSGYNNIVVEFDMNPSSVKAEAQFMVEYTTDVQDANPTWTDVTNLLTFGANDTANTVGHVPTLGNSNTNDVFIQTNSADSNTYIGSYATITGPIVGGSNTSWLNDLKVDLSGIPAVSDSAHFAFRVVNAATGTSETNISAPAGTAFKNWRFDEVRITGAVNTLLPPSIVTNPTDQVVVGGAVATFTASASGNPTPTVQWQVSKNHGGSFAPDTTDPGNTTNSLMVTGNSTNSGYEYEAIYSNNSPGLQTATTTAATLTVNSSPIITLQPLSQTVNAGSTVTFTAGASGTAPLTVLWKVSTNGGPFTSTGVTTTTLSFPATEGLTGNQYEAVFTNSAGMQTTNAATLTVAGTAIAQWNFSAGIAPTTGGAITPGNGNEPYPTFGPLTNTALTSGLNNDYTGTQAVPEADIIPLSSLVNASFKEFIWRMRSGSGVGPTGSPGTPEGWSQTAPQYDNANIGSTIGGELVAPQGAVFAVNTTGYTNITLHFDWDEGGISDMQAQYSPNGGSTWINVPGSVIEATGTDYYGITPTTTPTGINVNLQGVAAANNNPNFQLRLMAKYSPTLPLISDGNLIDPVVHGQFATGIAGPVNAQQVLQFNDTSVGGTLNDGDSFPLTYGGTTVNVTYSSNYSTLMTNLSAALTTLVGANNFSIQPTNYNSTIEGSSTLLQPVRDSLGNQSTDMTVTFNGTLAHSTVATITSTNTNVVIATWVNGSTSGFKPFVDGGGAWEIGNISFNGDSTLSGGLGITANPVATTVAGGGVATFMATAYSETLPTVVWQVSTNGGANWAAATGTTTPNPFTLSPSGQYTSTFTYTSNVNRSDSGDLFRAQFSNSGATVNSTGATLTVVAPVAPAIITQPVNASVLAGDPAKFLVAYTGAPTPTTVWQISSDGGLTWNTAVGGTTSTVSLPGGGTASMLSFPTLPDASQNGDMIRAQVSNPLSMVNSVPVTLGVLVVESNITSWDFSNPQYTPTISAYVNSPVPSGGAVTGTLSSLGMNVPYDPNNNASGNNGAGAVTDDDITASQGAAAPTYSEYTWRIRGGVPSTTGGTPAGGNPANGWSVYPFVNEYTQGAQISVPTTGYNRVFVTFDWFSTHSGELDAQPQYTTDGSTWINLGNQIEDVVDGNDDWYNYTTTGAPLPVVLDLTGIANVANNPNFGVRFVNAYNPTLSNTQTITLGDSSNFTLMFNGLTTGSIQYYANQTTEAAAIQSALGALMNVGAANVVVIPTPGNSSEYSVTFQNALNVIAQPAMTASDVNDTIGYHPQFANAQLLGAGTYGSQPPLYNGSKGNWRFGNIEVHGDQILPPYIVAAANAIYSWNPTTGALNLTSGKLTFIADSTTDVVDHIVSLTASGAGSSVVFNTTQHLAGLSLTGGATAVMTAPADGKQADASTLNLTSLTIDSQSQMDVTINTVIVNYGAGTDPAVQADITLGYNGGLFNGNGIISSSHDAHHGVGYTDNGTVAKFRWASYGDTNLDGTIDFADLLTLAQNYNSSTATWATGDTNYDHTINFADLLALAQNYNAVLPQATQQQAAATPPPPAQTVTTTDPVKGKPKAHSHAHKVLK